MEVVIREVRDVKVISRPRLYLLVEVVNGDSVEMDASDLGKKLWCSWREPIPMTHEEAIKQFGTETLVRELASRYGLLDRDKEDPNQAKMPGDREEDWEEEDLPTPRSPRLRPRRG